MCKDSAHHDETSSDRVSCRFDVAALAPRVWLLPPAIQADLRHQGTVVRAW